MGLRCQFSGVFQLSLQSLRASLQRVLISGSPEFIHRWQGVLSVISWLRSMKCAVQKLVSTAHTALLDIRSHWNDFQNIRNR